MLSFLVLLFGYHPAQAAAPLARVGMQQDLSRAEGIRNVIRRAAASNEKIRRLKAEELVDNTIVRKLEKEGRF